MCNELDAKRLILNAQKYEKTDPNRARKNYLEAAEIALLLSETDKINSQRWLKLAKSLYNKSQTIKVVNENFEEKKKVSNISFASIGGLKELKEEIRFKIIEPLKHPNVFAHFGKKAGGGILMYGPPGCGKSLIAEATANEAKAAFFHVKASDLKSKYVGETEKNISELFEKARKNQPSIIFFDEFEALGSDRSNSPVHEKNAVAQLLTEMDGLGNKNKKILLLAATNEPWSIDSALRRPGRFDDTLFVPPPDFVARHEIFKIHLKNKPLHENVNIVELARLSKGLSGADIMSVCERAADIPLKEYFKSGKLRQITMNDFHAALKKNKSIITQWFRKARIQLEKNNSINDFPELSRYVNRVNKNLF